MKLADPAVRRAIAASKLGISELARIHNVNRKTIRNIIKIETGQKVLKINRRKVAEDVVESTPCPIQYLFEAYIRQRRQYVL